jgi:sugar phosphate permease
VGACVVLYQAVLCRGTLSYAVPSTLQGVTSWFVFYLIKEKGVADAAQAAVRVSGLELGGLVGSLIAGRLSDMMINNSKKGEGAVGKRVQVGWVEGLWLRACYRHSWGAMQWGMRGSVARG